MTLFLVYKNRIKNVTVCFNLYNLGVKCRSPNSISTLYNTKAGCDQTRLFLEKNLADTDEEYNNFLKEDSNYVRRSVDAMCISDR